MPTKVIPLGTIRERIKGYIGRVPVLEISENEPASMVLAPVQAGLSRFIDIDNLPNINDLPFISERKRDFAFRYATEYKPHRIWATEYNVTKSTIEQWLAHPGVRAYIALCRYEQRTFNMAQRVSMQRLTNKTITSILNAKITGDTIGPIAIMARFMYGILNDPSSVATTSKGKFNDMAGYNTNLIEAPNDNPYAQERDVTPLQLKNLQEHIEELELLSKLVDIKGEFETVKSEFEDD